jgi:glyoxylase-like metal-dependent hydrolase (beta-lactamase superfamily II)
MRVWCNKGKNALKEKEEKLQEWIEIKNLFNSYVNLYSIQKDKIESQFYIHPELMTNGEDFENLSLLRQGDVLTVGDFQLHCIETPGHHYTHICLYEPHKKILFSGDHVLLDISPNITSFSIRSNPLDEYLESLDKIKSLDVDLVLPGHGSPFYELNNRIEELNIHHQRRLEEILNIIAQGHHNVFEICKHVKWNGPNGSWDKMPLLLKGFAVGETMAHLIYLLNMKKVSVDYSQNGILHFQLEC